jgi:hypothetical protein
MYHIGCTIPYEAVRTENLLLTNTGRERRWIVCSTLSYVRLCPDGPRPTEQNELIISLCTVTNEVLNPTILPEVPNSSKCVQARPVCAVLVETLTGVPALNRTMPQYVSNICVSNLAAPSVAGCL